MQAPIERFLSLPDIIGSRVRNIPAILPLSRTAWLDGVRAGKFPKPISLSPRRVAWRETEIRALVDRLLVDEREV